ncbi:DUF2461 domain-containing protein [Caulobacter rhizosphaerae]|jgi:uncharacterized protein (DUF2461 family)|uniref:DUF2461 domain-containing protein n=1 Tax=Caulobacter rhizosphaerae TaxID=2010972 RepID=UPI0013D549F4|nr:DUF2461 domain-containing protein [Caulobacter rhizosphaerae]GGL41988.1 TIGR02453 family protein [Caulobacter rhizosphaerae]
MTRTSFPGFAAADLAFLTGLAAHNDRDWFTANRAAYDDRLKPTLAALIDALNAAFAARDLPLAGDPKKSVFRIHRDVRFSKDKRPYKTHVSATLTRANLDGTWQKLSPGLVYVHIEPEGGPAPAFDPETIDPLAPSTLPSAQASEAGYFGNGPFAAAGFYLTERPDIDAFRRAIAADPKGWAAVETALVAKDLALDPGEPTKRMPKGFEDQAGGPLEPALKRTRWLVRRPLTGAEIGGEGLAEIIADFVADARPLLAFGWKALG